MKLLVTGAKGQVGTELVLEGKRRGHQVLAVGKAKLDITNQDSVSSLFEAQRPDILINAAAYTAVDRAESEPELAHAINRDGTANLARACFKYNIPLLHISTDYVFDGNKVGAYNEADTPNPQCVYGLSKLEGEQAIESIMEQYIILRVSWVYGAYGNNFVRTMLRICGEKEILSVVDDQQGCPTWSGSIAAVILSIAEYSRDREIMFWGTYHYSDRPAISWNGFATVIFEQAKELGIIVRKPQVKSIPTANYPTPAPRPLNSVLDCSKLAQKMGITQSDWRDGLKQVLTQWAASGD